MNNFLILGTGEDINKIDFNRIHPDFITAGVNRIYEKTIPDYYFVYDIDFIGHLIPEYIKTVYTHPDKLNLYFNSRRDYKHNYHTFYSVDYVPEFNIFGKKLECSHGSVSYLVRMFNDYLYKGQENVFYFAGVPLLESVGHFYQETEETTSKQEVLDRFFNDFIRLIDNGLKLYSVMEHSKLNTIMPTIELNSIYQQPREREYSQFYRNKLQEIVNALSK